MKSMDTVGIRVVPGSDPNRRRLMLPDCKCYDRTCRHFKGVEQPDGTEMTERYVCEAFPDGIPEDIAYGTNLHTEPVEGDHGMQYEVAATMDDMALFRE